MKTRSKGLEKAIELCGGQSELARLLNLTRGAVNHWVEIPIVHVLKLCDMLPVEPYELHDHYKKYHQKRIE